MASDRHARQAASFGPVAELYDRVRPGYPAAALDWLLGADARRVLDLGAGTGKLTAALRARGLEVVAVEPSDGMREVLTRRLADVEVLAGSGESIPLPDRSVDAVLVAQAWHWVDRARAVPEVARVLVPGGRLGLLWNVRDEREPWVARLGALLGAGNDESRGEAAAIVGPPFGELELEQVAWTQQLTPAELVELVASRSYVITLPEPDRAALLHTVADLTAHHPALAGRESIALPYLTTCARAVLPR